jgi:branched-subunit amino acid aminotransferase/4-amino-4-deoxychorismate lyase
MDNSKSDIGLCSNNKIFETGNFKYIFIKNDKVYSPINKFYKGITYKFFKSKIKKIIKKDILINSLKEFDEIILIGSGKGVASVKTINQIKWKRKSLKFYKILSNFYKSA